MNEELLNCPFCGGEAQVVVDIEFVDKPYMVECKKCDALSGHRYNKENAIKAWNKRDYEL